MAALAAVALGLLVAGPKNLRLTQLGSPPHREVGDLPAILWFASAGLAWLIFGIADAAVTGWLGIGTLEKTFAPLKSKAVIAGGAAALGCVAAGVLAALLHKAAPGAGLKPRAKDIPVGLLAALLAIPITSVISVLVSIASQLLGSPPEPIAHSTLETIASHQNNPWTWVLIAAVVILVPILEELIYRGMLQSGTRKLTGSSWAAAILASSLFTLVHLGAFTDNAQLIPLFALSVAMGIAYERTRSIGVPIVMHMAFNGWNVFQVLALA